MHFTKLYTDNKIQLQGVISEINITLTYIYPIDASELIYSLENSSP